MNTHTLTKYRAYRAEHPGIPARYALTSARAVLQALRPEIVDAVTREPWDAGAATWERDGFTLRLEVRQDDTPPDYPGTFGQHWKPGAVPHEQKDPQTLDWFHPVNTYESHRSSLSKLGNTRHNAAMTARRYVAEDHRRACDYGTGWVNLGLVVTVSREGVELGSASLWGIESDADTAYRVEIAEELESEALIEARGALVRLCGKDAEDCDC